MYDILLNSYRFEKQKVREEKLWRDGRVLKDYIINNLKFTFSYKVAALPKYVLFSFIELHKSGMHMILCITKIKFEKKIELKLLKICL